jgi:hypothetical protein
LGEEVFGVSHVFGPLELAHAHPDALVQRGVLGVKLAFTLEQQTVTPERGRAERQIGLEQVRLFRAMRRG